MKHAVWMVFGVAVLTMMAACGKSGGGGSPMTPTTPTPAPTTGGGNPSTATITIGTDGQVSPSTVTIARGGQVRFINNDTRAHEMSSDPHPEHSQCPELNDIGFLRPGEARSSSNLNTARTCGFHDHNLPNNAGLKGQIIIQ